MKRVKRVVTVSIITVLSMIVAAVLLFVAVNVYVRVFSSKYIITAEEASKIENVECITVLGAHVKPDGNPSLMLESRLDMAIGLFNGNVSSKMLLTGDHGRNEYDEVNNMMKYVLSNSDINKQNIFLDHAGFSTYESAYRAKEIFDVEKSVFVTQKYHLYRAVYNARKNGIDAYGVASDDYDWPGMGYYKFRESLAIFKDFFACLFNVKPTYLGDAVPVSGTSEATHDIKE